MEERAHQMRGRRCVLKSRKISLIHVSIAGRIRELYDFAACEVVEGISLDGNQPQKASLGVFALKLMHRSGL